MPSWLLCFSFFSDATVAKIHAANTLSPSHGSLAYHNTVLQTEVTLAD